MEGPTAKCFMKFSSVVCGLDDNPQVMPLAFTVRSGGQQRWAMRAQ